MFFQFASLCCVFIWSMEAAVLDPALYLSPNPPLTDTVDSVPPADLWSRAVDTRAVRDASDMVPLGINERPTTRRKPQPMERAKLFWPTLRTPQISLGSIQVPLTFGLSGTYRKYGGNLGMGLIGSSYGTVANAGDAAISALAGSSYGNYGAVPGLRIYGRESVPSWSGWGNGKWGHYGKG